MANIYSYELSIIRNYVWSIEHDYNELYNVKRIDFTRELILQTNRMRCVTELTRRRLNEDLPALTLADKDQINELFEQFKKEYVSFTNMRKDQIDDEVAGILRRSAALNQSMPELVSSNNAMPSNNGSNNFSESFNDSSINHSITKPLVVTPEEPKNDLSETYTGCASFKYYPFMLVD